MEQTTGWISWTGSGRESKIIERPSLSKMQGMIVERGYKIGPCWEDDCRMYASSKEEAPHTYGDAAFCVTWFKLLN